MGERVARVEDGRLSDYINAHIREHEMLAEALTKAESNVNERLGRMNELRDQINTERGRYVTRETLDVMLTAQVLRISSLERSLWLALGAVALAAFLIPLGWQLIAK